MGLGGKRMYVPPHRKQQNFLSSVSRRHGRFQAAKWGQTYVLPAGFFGRRRSSPGAVSLCFPLGTPHGEKPEKKEAEKAAPDDGAAKPAADSDSSASSVLSDSDSDGGSAASASGDGVPPGEEECLWIVLKTSFQDRDTMEIKLACGSEQQVRKGPLEPGRWKLAASPDASASAAAAAADSGKDSDSDPETDGATELLGDDPADSEPIPASEFDALHQPVFVNIPGAARFHKTTVRVGQVVQFRGFRLQFVRSDTPGAKRPGMLGSLKELTRGGDSRKPKTKGPGAEEGEETRAIIVTRAGSVTKAAGKGT